MTSENFVPKMIGKQDIEKYSLIKSLYSALVCYASSLMYETQNLLVDDEINGKSVINLLKMDKEELSIFLKRQHIKANKIEYPGLSVEKLISLGLIDLPQDYDIIIDCIKGINDLIDKVVLTKFNFPLSALIADQVNDGFNLNDEFENELLNFTARFTENEKQNEVLKVVEDFCSVVNDFIELGLVKPNGNMWMAVSEVLKSAVETEYKNSRPLFPDKKMFVYAPFTRFADKKPFVAYEANRDTIIN